MPQRRRETFVIGMAVNGKWSLNRIYSGLHKSARAKQAQTVHWLVRSAISRQCKPIRMFEKPVKVHIQYNSRLDIDNHGYLSKLIIDGMKGILIQDDTRRYVTCLKQIFHTENASKIFVDVIESQI